MWMRPRRPSCSGWAERVAPFHHVTVLRDEAVAMLAPASGRVIVDCTLGGGGHSEQLLEAGAKVLGIDRDPRAREAASERLARFGDRFVALAGNFQEAGRLCAEAGHPQVDGLLADLGVSSPQLDDAERGFSFMRAGPLDMRMGPDAPTLAEWLESTSEELIAQHLEVDGEEQWARKIARAIKAGLPFRDTLALADTVGQAIPRGAWPKRIHPATRTFQGLRIALNGEMVALDALLAALPGLLTVGGRAAFITFHSLEDRRVKQHIRQHERHCICPPGLPTCVCGEPGDVVDLKRGGAAPGGKEVDENPRARSSRLRGMERVR